jgi:hypothetical protein
MTAAEDVLLILTAHEVRAMTGVPVSTLHDWAAKRERGIAAPGPHHLRLSDLRLSGCQTTPSTRRHSRARSPMTNNDTDGPEMFRAQQKQSW